MGIHTGSVNFTITSRMLSPEAKCFDFNFTSNSGVEIVGVAKVFVIKGYFKASTSVRARLLKKCSYSCSEIEMVYPELKDAVGDDTISDLVFLDTIKIDSSLRGQGVGSKAIRLILENMQDDTSILALEACPLEQETYEMITDPIARRDKMRADINSLHDLYAKFGFQRVLDSDYSVLKSMIRSATAA